MGIERLEDPLFRRRRKYNKHRYKQAFTTGDVARMISAGVRTVNNWCDNGHLPHYRLPFSEDRRVARGVLIKFLQEHKVPLPPALLTEGKPAVYCLTKCPRLDLSDDSFRTAYYVSEFTFACAVMSDPPFAVVLDRNALSRDETLLIAHALRQLESSPLTVVLASEDDAAWGPPRDCIDFVSLAPHDLDSIKDYVGRYMKRLMGSF